MSRPISHHVEFKQVVRSWRRAESAHTKSATFKARMLLKTNEAGERLPRMLMKTNHLSRKARMLLKVQEITVEKQWRETEPEIARTVTSDK